MRVGALALYVFSAFLFLSPLGLWAQLDVSTAGSPVTVDFDATLGGVNNGQFNGSGFVPTPSAGQLDSDAWAISGLADGTLNFGGSQTGNDFALGTSSGGTSQGGIYAFEVQTGDYALGVQPAGSDFTPGDITLRLQNNTGSTVTSLDLSYEIWVRNDQARANSFHFSWSSDDVSYTNEASLDYTSPETAGPTAWVQINRTITLTGLSLNNGDFFYLRWTGADVSGSGSRDEFALDDINVTLNSGNAPPTITNITRSPAGLVRSGQNVTISADVTDADGVDTVLLLYGTDPNNLSSSLGMVLGSAPNYSATIPASFHSDGDSVFFALQATDLSVPANTGESDTLPYRVEDPRNAPYFQNFDALDNWRGNGVWEIGVLGSSVTSAPDSAYSPDRLAATLLDMTYPNNVNRDSLLSPLIRLNGAQFPRLSFWMFMDCDGPAAGNGEGGILWIKRNNEPFEILEDDEPGVLFNPPNVGQINAFQTDDGWNGRIPEDLNAQWAYVSVDLYDLLFNDLDQISGTDSLRFLFTFESNASTTGPGWYLDDFEIREMLEPVASFSADTLDAGTIRLQFTANGAGDSVLILGGRNNAFGEPRNPPTVGDSLAGAEVLYLGPAGQFDHSGLLSNTVYYYRAYSYRGNGPQFSAPLETQDTTGSLQVPTLGPVRHYRHDGYTINWDPVPGANAYLLQFGFTSFASGSGAASDLFFAKYAEANTGQNDAWLIYNGTGATVDLSDYRFRVYNSPTSDTANPTHELNLSGSLLQDEVYVISESSNNYGNLSGIVDATILSGVTGNDAVVLFKRTANPSEWELVDIIGDWNLVGGANWSVGGVAGAAADRVLTRKSTITGPNGNFWTVSGNASASQGTNLQNSEWTLSASAFNADYANFEDYSYSAYTDFVTVAYADSLVNDTFHRFTFPGIEADSLYFFRVAALNTENGEQTAFSPYDSARTWYGLSGNWSVSGNWIDGTGLPGPTDGVMVYGPSTLDLSSLDGDSLSVDSNVVFAIPAGNQLNLDGELIVYPGATLDLDSGAILNLDVQPIGNYGTIEVGSSAVLVQQGSQDENYGNGTYRILRWLAAADHRRFNIWSAPVQTTMNQVFHDVEATRTNPEDWFGYHPTTGYQWLALDSANPVAVNMRPGIGYMTTPTLQTDPAQYLDPLAEMRIFEGNRLNNGDIDTVFSGLSAGQNLMLGNPYPSPFSPWDFLQLNTDLDGTLYFWDHTSNTGILDTGTNYPGDYASWNALGPIGSRGNTNQANPVTGDPAGDLPDSLIQSTQGFFAVVVGGFPGGNLSVQYRNSMRRVSNNQQFFKAQNAFDDRKRVWLGLSHEEGYRNQTLIGMKPNATFGRDRLYDGIKFKGHPYLSFYSFLDSLQLCIQGLPYLYPQDPEHVVRLGVDAWKTGRYAIGIDSLHAWPQDLHLWLIDSLEGQIADLRREPYAFVVDSLQSMQRRFYLRIGSENPDYNPIGQAEIAQLADLPVYQQDGVLVIDLRQSAMAMESASLFTLDGRLLGTRALQNQNLNRWTLPVPQGIYLLQLQSQQGLRHSRKLLLGN